MKQVIFYAGARPERGGQLQRLMQSRRDIRYREIAPTEAGQLVGYLLGETGYPRLPGSADAIKKGKPLGLPKEILLLQGFAEEELTDFLHFLRCSFFVVELKAVVTEQNRHWTLAQLALELEQEHQRMQGGRG